MQNDFKNIQVEIEEKTKTNKKLLEDFNHLLFYLEKEVEVVEKLKEEKEIYSQSNQDLNEEKKNFGQNMLSLNYSKNEYLKELDFLTKQNNILNQQIEEEQNELNEIEQEKNKYIALNKEMKLKNTERLNVIKINDEAINYFQQQLNNSNITINKMVNMINELENYYKNLQNQYEQFGAKHKIIENKKFNNDKIYQELTDHIKKKESDISDNISVLDSISGEKEQLYNYNNKIYNDLDRLQNHIYELAEQNQKLFEKISKFQKIEEMINNHIMSKKEMNGKLNDEKNFVENKIGNELKKFFSSQKEIEDKKQIKDNNIDTIKENKIENNSEFLDENKKSDLNSENKLSNNIETYNNIEKLTDNQSENIIFDKRYNNLFREQKENNLKDNYNYLGFQKELELEHDYE